MCCPIRHAQSYTMQTREVLPGKTAQREAASRLTRQHSSDGGATGSSNEVQSWIATPYADGRRSSARSAEVRLDLKVRFVASSEPCDTVRLRRTCAALVYQCALARSRIDGCREPGRCGIPEAESVALRLERSGDP